MDLVFRNDEADLTLFMIHRFITSTLALHRDRSIKTKNESASFDGKLTSQRGKGSSSVLYNVLRA